MRKLLSILGALAITSVSTTTVVACGKVKLDNIPVSIGGKSAKDGISVNGIDYSGSDLINSIDGAFMRQVDKKTRVGGPLIYPIGDGSKKHPEQITTAIGFNQLNDYLFRVVTMNPRMITKPQNKNKQLREMRDVFAGRFDKPSDRVLESDKGVDVPSVDGARINKVDTDAYYTKFNKTYINSLFGLNELSNYSGDNNELGDAAKKTKEQMDKLFNDPKNPEISKKNKENFDDFYHKFINGMRFSAFTGVNYESLDKDDKVDGKSVFREYNTRTAAFSHDENGTKIEPKNNLEFVDYATNNSAIKSEDVKKDLDKPITNRSSDPMGRLILAPDNNGGDNIARIKGINDGIANFDLSNDVDINLENNPKLPIESFSNSTNAYYHFKDNGKDKWTLKNNQLGFHYEKIKPIKVTYTFETSKPDKKNNSKVENNKYEVSFKLDNIVAIFSPTITNILQNDADKKKDEDNKDLKRYQFSWTFSGYKFINHDELIETLKDTYKDYNSQIKPETNGDQYQSDLRYELNHQLRDLKTTNWDIKKVN